MIISRLHEKPWFASYFRPEMVRLENRFELIVAAGPPQFIDLNHGSYDLEARQAR